MVPRENKMKWMNNAASSIGEAGGFANKEPARAGSGSHFFVTK
jgi:hypothetical protein